MGDDLDNIISLNDENGDEVEFELLDQITYEGEEYIVLLPVEEEDGEEGEVVILRATEDLDEDMQEFSAVEDEEILDEVFQLFKERNRDDFDFEE